MMIKRLDFGNIKRCSLEFDAEKLLGFFKFVWITGGKDELTHRL